MSEGASGSSLAGSHLLVTGATGGLGLAVVAELAAHGATVTGTYVEQWERERALDTLGDSALDLVEVDLLEPAAVSEAVARAQAPDGGLAGVACLAGGFSAGTRVDRSDGSDLAAMLAINLRTAWNTAGAALPALEKSGGTLVLVGARAALEPFPGGAAYAVSKSAVLGLARALAAEWGERGVRVNALLPRMIDTPANREAMPDADTSRWTAPEAIARTLRFLLSAESDAVTGAEVAVDTPAG